MASIRRVIGLASVLFILSACGGGSSSSGDSGAQTPPPSTQTYSVGTSITGSGSGSISPTSQAVSQGSTTSFTISPASDSAIAGVSGCGGSLSGSTYTTGAISSSCTVTATFDLKTYAVTATAGSGGSVSVGSLNVTHGGTGSFGILPDSDYEISSVSGCGGSLSGNTYTTGRVTAACSVSATFSQTATPPPPTFTVSTLTTGTGSGSITPGSATVNQGQTASFTISPAAVSEIASVSGCNGALTGNTYITGPVNTNCAVTASFRLVSVPPPVSYSVTTSTSGNGAGTITPGSATVEAGQSASFQVAAGEGSAIANVTGCGGSLNGNTFATGAINAECQINAAFSLNSYTVTTTAGEGGSVSPTSANVEHGAFATFTVTPQSGYSIATVSGCSGSLDGTTYTTGVITGACTVAASFSLNTYEVTATAGTGGGISPSLSTVEHGSTASFTVTPDAGYSIATVVGCEGALDGQTYTTGPVTGACSVTATFALNTYEVTATAGTGGSIDPSLIQVEHDSTASFTVTPSTGYSISGVNGCGGSLQGATYTTAPITAACTVSASFSLNTYEVTATAGPGGSVTPESKTVDHGSTARFALTPDEGYEVERASGCEGSVDGSDYVTGPVTADCEVNVSFIVRQFSVVLTSSSGGSASGAGVYTYGEEATLTATVGAGYDFSGWFESGQLLSHEPVLSFMVDADRTIGASFEPMADVIVGRVAGFDPTRSTLVTLTSIDTPDTLDSVAVEPDGSFIFSGLRKDQSYQVAVSQRGNRFVAVADPAVQEEIASGPVPITFDQGLTTSSGVAIPGTELEFHGFPVSGLEENQFIYEWTGDVSVSGYEYSSYVNTPLPIVFEGADLSDVDGHGASTLLERFGILLVDDEASWSPEHATRLLQGMERTGVPEAMGGHVANPDVLPYPSRWSLTTATLPNDIEVTVDELGDVNVRISATAFTYASPVIGTIEGKRGRFFSNRLFKSIIRFVTDEGRDIQKAAEIIQRRYGVRIATDEYFDGLYESLPVIPEDRFAGVWQTFHPEEVVELIAMLEEFPDGMKDLSLPSGPGGLRYILRRRDGLPHPLYGAGTTAVAWTGAHYIEFLDNAFGGFSQSFIQRLIIHEKAHFLWDYSFSAELKYNWLKFSGWYLSDGTTDGQCDLWQLDPGAWQPPNVSPSDLSVLTETHDHQPGDGTPPLAAGWASCSSTQFASAYAAALNPNEDMAESISYFLTNPDQLRSTSLPKYEFIRDYIMQGSVYVSMFRPDLTFEVLNLYPDYIYPGKINRVRIEVAGAPDEDKEVTVTLGLTGGMDCLDPDNEYCFSGASGGFMRLLSRVGTFQDVYFSTANGASLDTTLVARFTMHRTAALGWWSPRDIAIFDQAGNRRVQKMTNADFGWQLFLNNPLEDTTPPEYIPASAQSVLLSVGDPGASEDLVGDERELVLRWRVIEDNDHVTCFSRIVHYSAVEGTGQRFYDQSGVGLQLDGWQSDGATHSCEIRWRITRYMPSGSYGPGYISMNDSAYNWRSQEFAFDHATYETPPTVDVYSPFEDLVAPVLNIEPCVTADPSEECIRVNAFPVNPDAPDGETVVRISYWAYELPPLESASGVNIATLSLRNPQGQEFFWYHGDGSTGVTGRSPMLHRLYFACPSLILGELGECDATTRIKYEFEVRLPVGSAPGTWGLTEMTVGDHAGNRLRVQFTEVIRFDLE